MLLEESSISEQLVAERGYRTVETKAELERLGFGRSQRNVPALVIPVFGPSGDIELYQSRPDEPRIGKRGKPVKYETPGGERMALDVHPSMREAIRDPSRPLFITEGIKKGDALASRELATVSLIGVWTWRGTNEHGGKAALSAWEYVALEGRKVYIVFDSDAMEKRDVHVALSRLKAFLEGRKAKVLLIYLPAGESGRKQGVDDYLSSGHTVDDLLSHATPELRSPSHEDEPGSPYRATPSGLVWEKPTQNGSVPTLLTNFTAKITADISEDDGAEFERRFEIEAYLVGKRYVFTVPAKQFQGMSWVTEHLGAGAIVQPGFGLKDHARAAIQTLSGEISARRVYAHTGWREIDGRWVYLHAGGGIGKDGVVPALQVALSGNLTKRVLPEPPDSEEALACAVRASLMPLELVPKFITVPLLSGVYRAVLGDSDFSIHLSGPTGEGKSELAALCQQHFGTLLDARHLTSWESTANALEGQAFAAKDQVMVIDDFSPTGNAADVQRLHRKADQVLRAKGNTAGRERMRPDTSLRPEKPPRALIYSTGEEIPHGQSLRARMVNLEIGPGMLDWKGLTEWQRAAAEGLCAASMSGFVRWLAGRYEEVRSSLKQERASLREAASRRSQHRRTPGTIADLALGLRYFLLFAHDCGTLEETEAESLWLRGWEALLEVATHQIQHQVAGEPTTRFRELLGAAVASGRAHVAAVDGSDPETPGAWGWRISGDEWRPQGERIGWLEAGGENLYLQPDAAFAAAQRQGRDSGDALTISVRTLRKRLHERGLLLSTGKESERRETLTVRHTLEGSRKSVLHTAADFLYISGSRTDQTDHNRKRHHSHARNIPLLWSDPESATGSQPDHRADHAREFSANGQVEGEQWSDFEDLTDQESDQQKPHTHAREEPNGHVGQFADGEKARDRGRGARTRWVRGRL